MTFTLTGQAGILLLTSALSVFAAWLVWDRRAVTGGTSLALFMLAAAVWSLAAALEASATGLQAKILFSTLEYVGSGSCGVLFLLVASHFSHKTNWLTPFHRAVIWILPVLGVALAATNALHGLVWTGFSEAPGLSNAIIYGHGPGFFLYVGLLYVYLAAATGLLVPVAVRASAGQRLRAITLLASLSATWAGSAIYLFLPDLFPGLNLAPISFLASGTILLIGILPLRLFELLPVARDTLVDSMSDGILVIDAAGRIIDMNGVACEMLGELPRSIGEPAAEVLAPWPVLLAGISHNGSSHAEFLLRDDPPLMADVRISPVRPVRQGRGGHLIVMRDNTRRHAAQMALQDANQRLEILKEELREQAIRDALTGLHNRRYLDETLPGILESARSRGETVAAMMFDIDHFKSVNDRHGHRAGDLLLKDLGRLMQASVRPADMACRYGGEEFVVILPGADLETAIDRTEAIRRAFAEKSLSYSAIDKAVTLSVGIALFPPHGMTRDELLHAADEALYEAKDAGRNRISVASAVCSAESGVP